MTLETIINDFLNEEYSFFKYRDKDGNDIYVRLDFESHHDFFQQYMNYYTILIVYYLFFLLLIIAIIINANKKPTTRITANNNLFDSSCFSSSVD